MLMSRDDIARLCTHLVVPVAVGDILHNKTQVQDDIQYGLHEMLSNMEPDTALLAIAISAQHIGVRFAPDSAMAVALAFEGEKVVDEYAHEWLDHVDGRGVTREADAIYDLLTHVPEDLEMLADLLGAVQSEIESEQEPAWQLADILILQARAHIEIAEFILQHSSNETGDGFVPLDAANGNNIILFPGTPQY